MAPLIQATLQVYLKALRESAAGLKRNWYLPLIPILYFLLMMFVGQILLSLFGQVAGGFALGMIEVILLANFLGLVALTVEGDKFKPAEFWPRTRDLIFPVISILFALFVVQLLLQVFSLGGNLQFLRAAINLALFVFGNALPEVCYQRGYNALAAFQESAEFLRENFVEWFIPLGLMCLPMIVVAPRVLLQLLASSDPMKFSLLLFEGYGTFASQVVPSHMAIATVLALYLSFFLMVFRGVLFRELSTTTRRKRMFNWQQSMDRK